MTSTKWFVCPQPNPSAERRLFMFPYAGGAPAAFSRWVVNTIESQIVHYPGRGSRFNEPPIGKIETLVENLLHGIQPLLDKPFAFFGHSMGGLVAFELARRMRRQNLPLPNILFISACGAAHIPDPNPPIHSLPDADFLEALKKFGGIPAGLMPQTEAMQYLLPSVRADFDAVETYRYAAGKPLNIPIVAFGGLDDPRVSRERIEGWASQTASQFESHYFPGGHFFINTAAEQIMRLVAGVFHADQK